MSAYGLVVCCMLGTCSREQALSEAAEAKAQPLPNGAVEVFEDTLVKALSPCSAADAVSAMSSRDAATRARGAVCAAQVPCSDRTVDAALADLADDQAIAVGYVDRGPMFGSGDQTVRVPVARFATRAIFRREQACAVARADCLRSAPGTPPPLTQCSQP